MIQGNLSTSVISAIPLCGIHFLKVKKEREIRECRKIMFRARFTLVNCEGQHENADNLCYNGINLLFYRNFLDIEKPFEYSDIFLFSKPLYRSRFNDEG